MEIVVTVAALVLPFLLALAVTVHFFWLSDQGRWPPDLPVQTAGDVGNHRPARPRGRRESHA